MALLWHQTWWLYHGSRHASLGPSRARYFPRDMLLLTTTARERAWRLLKITSPLIGWFDEDSPIPGISPWLAPPSRCALYIVEVQRTLCSCLFVFEIRTVASTLHPSIRLVDREGVESVWKAACAVRTSRNCHEDDDALRVRCIQSQFAMLYFSSLTFRSSDLFFFLISKAMSIKPRTVQGFGLKGWGPFEGCADSDNLVTMEVFGNVSTKRLSMPHGQQMAQYLRSKIRAPTTKPSVDKDASFGWFVTAYVRLLESPYKCKSARKF